MRFGCVFGNVVLGETWACSTGACACAVASVLNAKADRDVTVHLRGGDLHIFWDEYGRGFYGKGRLLLFLTEPSKSDIIWYWTFQNKKQT